MLYYASKYRRPANGRPKRVESIGFSRLVAALSTTREMNEVTRDGEFWIVTIRHDGGHFPALIGKGSGAAVALKRGAYDLQRGDTLAPPAAA